MTWQQLKCTKKLWLEKVLPKVLLPSSPTVNPFCRKAIVLWTQTDWSRRAAVQGMLPLSQNKEQEINWEGHCHCSPSATHKQAEQHWAAGHRSRSIIWTTLCSPGLSVRLCFVKTELGVTPSAASTTEQRSSPKEQKGPFPLPASVKEPISRFLERQWHCFGPTQTSDLEAVSMEHIPHHGNHSGEESTQAMEVQVAPFAGYTWHTRPSSMDSPSSDGAELATQQFKPFGKSKVLKCFVSKSGWKVKIATPFLIHTTKFPQVFKLYWDVFPG